MYHDSSLARFLIIRALFNQRTVGHTFYWLMKASIKASIYTQRFFVVLETYLRYSAKWREYLRDQTIVYNKLSRIAFELKTIKDSKRKNFLRESLTKLQLPEYFQVPVNCGYIGTGFILEKCKYLDSKTFPLWLVIQNFDTLGDPIIVLFKVGDDLRQDQLILQMFRIMDQLWLSEGLDLKMSPYRCIETGDAVGMIEVVLDSETAADIQMQYGGLTGAFSEKPLHWWLSKNNPDAEDFKLAVLDFVSSCAGYCVATYVLGIGDRHNDNIMCTKKGHMFHIDFGKWLGNSEKFVGISRDRAPFVFTPDMAYLMGGTESSTYKHFCSLCCKAFNILRHNSSVFINLFAMMIDTGIAELKSEDDLNYLREVFLMDKTDEEASEFFMGLIKESLKTKATQLNFALHLLAHPQRE
eukprot:TRINITY_DN3961_c0_g1_i1.p1 TRINITY_DN3961_c0_g1~~TRINITY_DN3961_c0_g1_i1.p1  ORF type:complete len:411 (+),score=43.66 TRINITY_DN3961_c0_g1_i1:1131-2363(+)